MLQHNFQNLPVSLLHSFFSDKPHTADGFRSLLLQNSRIGRIGLVVHRQVMGQKGRVQAGGDFRGSNLRRCMAFAPDRVDIRRDTE